MDINKPCYPLTVEQFQSDRSEVRGLTFREQLLLSLASNPAMITVMQGNDDRFYPDIDVTAANVINQTNAILSILKNEDKDIY
jgi:hypothetical protein